VDLVGAARYPGAVGSGQWLLSVGQGAATSQAALATVNPGGWQRLRAPTFTVAAGWQPVALSWSSSASPGLARLDDVRCQIGSWWDHDNLGNLGFELGCRHQGHVPTYWSAPDCWRSSQLRCEPDASVVRPGAAPGSRSVRCSLQGALGNVWKDLTFLRAGEVIRVTGWVRGVSANSNARMQAIVGNGPNYFQNVAPNVFSPIFACDGVWRQFTLDYTVPANPIYTHIDIYMNDAAGSQCWFDDDWRPLAAPVGLRRHGAVRLASKPCKPGWQCGDECAVLGDRWPSAADHENDGCHRPGLAAVPARNPAYAAFAAPRCGLRQPVLPSDCR
jgi:hypothetical protein